MGKRITTIVVLLAFGALGVWYFVHTQRSAVQDDLLQRTEERIQKLKDQVDKVKNYADELVTDYRPQNKGNIEDLTVRIDVILKQLPGVAKVDVFATAETPTHRIIHIRDLHIVPKNLFAIDVRAKVGRSLSDQEIDALYEALLLETQLIQLEQVVILRCLVQHHGVKRVFMEGFTTDEEKQYTEHITALRGLDKEILAIRKQRSEVLQLLKNMEPGTERYKKAQTIKTQLDQMLGENERRLLKYGSAGKLLITNDIQEVLPLDDAKLLEQAKPVTLTGHVRFDDQKIEQRQDYQVKVVMERGHFGLIILGGAHDLSDNVKRIGKGRCEYIRVSTKRYLEFEPDHTK